MMVFTNLDWLKVSDGFLTGLNHLVVTVDSNLAVELVVHQFFELDLLILGKRIQHNKVFEVWNLD